MGRPQKIRDLTNQKFGRVFVISHVSKNKHGRPTWLCKCDCGNEFITDTGALISGNTSSCGCRRLETLANRALNLVGQKFNRLTVIEKIVQRDKTNKIKWLCHCECGKDTIVSTQSLRNQHTVSCGCFKNETAHQNAKKLLSKDPRITSAKAIYKNRYDDGDISFEQFLELTQQPCFYCGVEAKDSNVYNRYNRLNPRYKSTLENISDGNFYYNGIDRIDSSKGHLLNNVVTCCKTCNYAKRDTPYEEFVSWIKRAHGHIIQKEKDLDCSKSFSETSVIQA